MLTSLSLIFLCGLILGAICKRLGLPSLIGMLITGIILGYFNLLDGSIIDISADLRQLALIIILTRAGLSLNLEDLKKIGRPAVLLSFVPACFEMTGTILLAPTLLDLPILDAAILGAVIASVSPAIIVPQMLKLMEAGYGTDKRIPQLILAGASVDDVFNIVVFASLLSLARGETISAVSFASIPTSIFTGIFIGVLSGFLLAIIFQKFHMRDSVKVIIILSVAFLFVELEDVMQGVFPFSGLLAVMSAGVIILKKAPAAAKRVQAKFSRLWVGAEIVLFVLVGASVNIEYAFSAGAAAIFLLIAVQSVRAAGILICLIKTNLLWKERLFCVFAGIPKATVQASIGAIPLSMGLPCGEIILTVAVVSILFTAPVGAICIDKMYKKLLTKK